MASSAPATSTLARRVEELLVCPESHQRLTVESGEIKCATSGFTGVIRDGVVVLMNEDSKSFFDDKFEVMLSGHDDEGEWNFCYAEQVRLLERHLQPGMVVVDVGCGPSLPYKKKGAFVIGLEPSFPSIRSNQDVDMKVMGSAAKMPIANQSLDVVVCFYAIHHFVGRNLEETRDLVTRAFREFARVIKPGGTLFVFEMIPMAPAAMIQRLIWNPARKVLGRKLDMHFWTAEFFDRLRSDLMRDVVLERVFFQSSLKTIIRPAFSVPQLKIYRFLYPLAPKLFKFLF